MNPLKPTPSLLSKLCSIIIHSEELASPTKWHQFDLDALRMLLKDSEIVEWLSEMKKMAMIPEKRA